MKHRRNGQRGISENSNFAYTLILNFCRNTDSVMYDIQGATVFMAALANSVFRFCADIAVD